MKSIKMYRSRPDIIETNSKQNVNQSAHDLRPINHCNAKHERNQENDERNMTRLRWHPIGNAIDGDWNSSFWVS